MPGASADREAEADGNSAPAEGAPPIQNWAELYAIVGSLFESGVSVTDHLAMLQHLPDKQRCGAGTGGAGGGGSAAWEACLMGERVE